MGSCQQRWQTGLAEPGGGRRPTWQWRSGVLARFCRGWCKRSPLLCVFSVCSVPLPVCGAQALFLWRLFFKTFLGAPNTTRAACDWPAQGSHCAAQNRNIESMGTLPWLPAHFVAQIHVFSSTSAHVTCLVWFFFIFCSFNLPECAIIVWSPRCL